MKSIFSSSAIVATAILLGSLIFSAKSSVAETASPQDLSTRSKHESSIAVDTSNTPPVSSTDSRPAIPVGLTPALPYVATAYSLRGRTASGRYVAKGIIAADPRVLPLGSRVHIQAGGYSGEYLVADTGGAVKGKRIDIWTPSTREAFRFGRRTVKLTVLSYGPQRSGRTARAAR
jgi:3D (Asp-Asp-Asp) domain-containing protein